jgi:iron complex outermembrane receptor protein
LTTLDGQVSYALEEALSDALKNLRIAFKVKNLTNRAPPFAIDRAAASGYDPENADPYGRVVSVGFTWAP